MYFHPKLAWPTATYDNITRNHSNWPSLNLSQNVHEGWTNSYWKHQVLTFYPLGKKLRKPYGGVAATEKRKPEKIRWFSYIHNSIIIPSRAYNEPIQGSAPSWLVSSIQVIALHWYRRAVKGSIPVQANFFQAFFFTTAKVASTTCDDQYYFT